MNSRHVLAIDDQTEILEVIKLAVELTTDWTLHTATSGSAALVTSGGTHAEGQYDVVLLDVTIPGETAERTVRDLREHGVGDAIVLLTGAPLTEDQKRAIGADGLVSKPFDPMTLADDISRELGWVAHQ
jgi:CheY-like chemotaxis protein